MGLSSSVLAKGAIWTVGGYAVGQALRFVTSVILARLLAPELFGVMVVVNTLRSGAELVSDLGIGQSVVRSPGALTPEFLETAWTLQCLRGAILFILCALAAIPAAQVYDLPILHVVLPLSALTFLFGGFTALTPFVLQRRLEFARLNIFDTTLALVFSVGQVLAALVSPTIWALVFGLVFGAATRMVGSFLLPAAAPHRFALRREHVREIVSFGKWIFFSSLLYFASASYDRLYLAAVLPVGQLGIYGIARTIVDIITAMILRLGNSVVFPFVASQAHVERAVLRAQLRSPRLKFLVVAALGLGVFAAGADVAVRILFDPRYHSAGWMLSILALGAWFSILTSLNEAILLGFGKPVYGAAANAARFVWLAAALPFGLAAYGLAGAVAVVAAGDLARYATVLVGQRRERFSYALQDIAATILLGAAFAASLWLRTWAGLPFAS